MFGYIRPYEADLTDEEKRRYKAVYCGLCRALKERFGLAGRMGLNFDMTFLILLLDSLYEPEETSTEAVCPPHPVKKHLESASEFTLYAADMTVALAYYKALDDWEDEKKASGRMYAGMLKKSMEAVKERLPEPCRAIGECIDAIHGIERDPAAQPEQAADLSGRMLGAVFSGARQDFWRDQLAWLGYSLGKFVYMIDAAVDYEHDLKKGCFNPLPGMNLTPEEARPLLQQPLGEAAEAFEQLPLIQDAHLMRNILYSGVWQRYNETTQKKAGEQHGP